MGIWLYYCETSKDLVAQPYTGSASQFRPEFTPCHTVHLHTVSRTPEKSDAYGKGGRKATKISICSILPITDPCLGAKGSYIYTQIINAQPLHYKTQVEILSKLLSSQWLWYSLYSLFQYNAALFIFIHNALQRHLGFDDATFFCVAFHCISAFYHIKH